jgi:hypothetical protein
VENQFSALMNDLKIHMQNSVISVTHRKTDELRLRPREVWIDTWQAKLTVGNQSFDVGPKYETEVEAQWMAEQLREALYR